MVRVLPFGSGNAVTPLITLASYFDMVIGLLLSFGLAFQLPLVVLALVRIGILEIETLKKMRRIVYFVLTVIAAVIVPDVVTGMVALMIPLILLYEFGILLASWGTKKEGAATS
jgi:sec-independent protein translocase protein TatC